MSQEKKEGGGEEMEELRGGCHCGRVRWRVLYPIKAKILSCTCSRCTMLGYLHIIVDKDKFFLEDTSSPHAVVTEYRFNTGVAIHKFCSFCGVQSYYHPRSHPEGISVNARCVDGGIPCHHELQEFDGRNWEKNIDTIR